MPRRQKQIRNCLEKEADNHKCYKWLLNKQHLQVSRLKDIPFLSYLPKRFTQIYRDQYRDAVLVPIRMGTNMAAGNPRKQLLLTSAFKANALSLRVPYYRNITKYANNANKIYAL